MKIKYAILLALLTVNVFNAIGRGNEKLKCNKQAKPLLKQKRFIEAIAVYEKAAHETSDIDYNYYFLKNASEIAFKNLKDFEKAETLASKIKNPNYKKSQLLSLLAAREKWEELIDTYKNEDINKWPFNCRLESFRLRGVANRKMGNIEAAIRDLRNARNCNGKKIDKGRVCLLLGEIYQNDLKDDEEALAAYKQGLKVSRANYAWRNECFLKMIDIMLKQKKSVEALEQFENINFSGLPNSYWRGLFLLKYAKVLRAEKYNGQAATQLVKVLRMGDALEAHKKVAQKELDELIKEMEGN